MNALMPSAPPALRVVRVESAREMLAAVEASLPADIAVFAAAVSLAWWWNLQARDDAFERRLAAVLAGAVGIETGTATDLSHGRTALRIQGPKAEWVLSKLFAIDFSPDGFPVGTAISTNHHEIFAQIHRTNADRFDLYVFRSFARSFWQTLTRAAEETGYEVI